MEIKRSGSQPSSKGQADYFTGNLLIDPLTQAPAPARVSIASVTFEPGARRGWTKWQRPTAPWSSNRKGATIWQTQCS